MKNTFYTSANKILKKYNCQPTAYCGFGMTTDTNYGRIFIRVQEDTMRNRIFSIFMFFDDPNFRKEEFMNDFIHDNFNQHSYKWNIHSGSMADALSTLENRMQRLTSPINQSLNN